MDCKSFLELNFTRTPSNSPYLTLLYQIILCNYGERFYMSLSLFFNIDLCVSKISFLLNVSISFCQKGSPFTCTAVCYAS